MIENSSQIFSRLAAMGCNIEETLEDTYMGNEALYLKQLVRLAGSDTPQKMLAAVRGGDVAECFEAAHELKGLYATMGLEPLYRSCCVIVEATRGEQGRLDGVLEKAEALAASHEAVLGEIRGFGAPA